MTTAAVGARVDDGSALLARLRGLRTGAPAYSTNYFSDATQSARWASGGLLQEIVCPGCILVLRRDRDFEHLYHAADSPASLAAALGSAHPALRDATLVADLVDRPAALVPVVDAYSAAGFAPYRALVRMARPRQAADAAPTEPGAPPPAERATLADVPAVIAFFERLLDPYSEQIPTADEMSELVVAGSVLIVRTGAALGGVLVYEIHGQTAILRYWWVDDIARGAGVGARLIRSMFRDCHAAARIVLWVVEGNDNAITKYEHYGFRREGLVDQLMIRSRSEHP